MKSIIILAVLLSVFSDATAQQKATLRLHDGREVKGSINHILADSVYITPLHQLHSPDREQAMSNHVYSRGQLDIVTLHGGSRILSSTLIGLGIGVAAGGLLTLGIKDEGAGFFTDFFRFAIFSLGTVTGLIGGLTYGLIAGSSDTTFDMSRNEDFASLRQRFESAAVVQK
jgi:hypothetical protein